VYRHFRTPGHANKSKPAIDSLLAKFKDGELIKDSTELHSFLKSQPVEPALPFLDPAQKHYWCLSCESGFTTEKGCIKHIKDKHVPIKHTDDEFTQAINNMESFYLQKIGFTNNPVYRKCLQAVFGKQSVSQKHRDLMNAVTGAKLEVGDEDLLDRTQRGVMVRLLDLNSIPRQVGLDTVEPLWKAVQGTDDEVSLVRLGRK
jgi:hypothetical protein